MLVTLPGSPTDFVGDKEGSSGYETKSNNDFQQNRNVVPFEWVNKELKNPYLEEFNDSKDFAVNYYVNMTKIGNLRNKKELSALRNGNTISIPVQNGVTDKGEHLPVAATFRYDDKGSQVICLYTTSGANLDNSKMMNRDCVNLDKIVLNDNTQKNWKEGLKGGLNVGDTFLKVDDNARYKVFLENGEYCIKRVDSPIFRSISILPQDKNTAVLYKIDPKAYQPIHATLFNDNMI